MHDGTPDPQHDENGDLHPEEIALQGIDISIETMWRLYGEINEWIRAQDFKAGVVLAANGVIIVAGAALVVGGGSLSASVLHRLVASLCFLTAVVTVIISSAYAALCLVPPVHVGEVTSPLFFEFIALHYPSAQAYEEDIRTSLNTADANLKLISHQVWTSARSMHRKMSYINWAIRFFIATLFFSLCTVLFAFL